MTKKVLDLSKHNGEVDFRKIKNDGIYGIIQRMDMVKILSIKPHIEILMRP